MKPPHRFSHKNCILCDKPLKGRADKKYCNTHCKNLYASKIRQINLPIRQRIDRFLHRNHTILFELQTSANRATKFYVPRAKLQRMGFRFNNYTSTYLNSRGKLYYYVYDYRWMEFSDDMIMVVHNGPRSSHTD